MEEGVQEERSGGNAEAKMAEERRRVQRDQSAGFVECTDETGSKKTSKS